MANDPLSNMVMALNDVPEAQAPGNVTYSLGYPHTLHQTTMPDLGSALKAQRNMQDILNLPTTLHGKGSMLDGPPVHLAGDVLYPSISRFLKIEPGSEPTQQIYDQYDKLQRPSGYQLSDPNAIWQAQQKGILSIFPRK